MAGRLFQEGKPPAVGDWAAIETGAEKDGCLIRAILQRRSQFLRQAPGRETRQKVIAANIDTVFLMTAVSEEFNLRRLERFLVVAWESGARPVVVLTKSDLMPDVGIRLAEAESVAGGVPVHAVSCLTGQGLDTLDPYLTSGHTLAMLGSSGVGKSTLVNRLLGENLLATAAIRESDGRGRHTTTRQLLLRLPGGALVIDTPGLRQLKPWQAEEGLERTFSDVEDYAEQCRYRDCSHQHEPGCAVQQALAAGRLDPARFENYLKLQRELGFQARRRDESLAREEKQQNKRLHRMMRRIMEDKRKRWGRDG